MGKKLCILLKNIDKLTKRAKNCVFCSKTPDFGPKKYVTDLGGTPPPHLRFFFRRKGSYGFWGYPPTFTDKIRKVVFDRLPNNVGEKLRKILNGLEVTEWT